MKTTIKPQNQEQILNFALKANKINTIQVNNLTTKTSLMVRATKQEFVDAMNKKPKTKLALCNRTDNGWYVLEIDGTRMILDIKEN